jgi:nitric oxide reductase activation protein
MPSEETGWEDLKMGLEKHGRLRICICARTAAPHWDKSMQRTLTNHNIVQQVQRQETSLAQDPHRYLSDSPTMLE